MKATILKFKSVNPSVVLFQSKSINFSYPFRNFSKLWPLLFSPAGPT